jgi:hypothetical protein
MSGTIDQTYANTTTQAKQQMQNTKFSFYQS